MARILHVITELTMGGTETMLSKLLSATSTRHQHAVVSLKPMGPMGQRIADLGIPVISLRLRAGTPNPLRARSIRSLARDFRPQLIQGWMSHGNLMALLAAGGMQERVPVIWSIRHSLYDFAPYTWPTACVIRLNAWLSRRATRIVYVSQISKSQHEAFGYDASNSLVIPNGFDCQIFVPDQCARRQVRAELRLQDDAVLIGLVARYHPVKDHAGFLRAAALVAKAHPSARFVLVGPGIKEQSTLRSLMEGLGIDGRVFLLGERADIPRLTAAFDIACSASWTEGFCTAIGEAMACGVPCVATDVGDSAYLVGDAGHCVSPRNPEALAGALSCLISAGPERRQQLGASARCRVENSFSLPAIVGRYEDIYREHLPPDS